ncbi:hypothetical protein [Microbacterium invictum]|uniref:Uncharacterized protein n=1 Tax=Microbacterium invictum TaxID=515415 RepID=A0AA40VN20_9MICO|nr:MULTISPECIES: hypothetical protein [Microbacterium]MBB4139923.1 hypothetical protein [Microbacterium invictum]
MNATVHTAYVLDQHRAAVLDRENELLRRQAERPAAGPHRLTGFAVVTDWLTAIVRRPRAPLAAH